MTTAPAVRDHAHLHTATAEESVQAAVAALRARGERVTAPRRAVLEVLAGRSDHLTADEVAALLERSDVHRATVYRTLDLLVDAGVVSHRHVAGGAARYHLATSPDGSAHLHGHCRSCGRVVVLRADAFDDVARALQRNDGFVLDVQQSAFAGVCAQCADS